MPRGRRTPQKKGKMVQSESWNCPPIEKKPLISDSPVPSSCRRASLRLLAKKANETRTTRVQTYQVLQCSVAEPESPPRQVVHPSIFAPVNEAENAMVIQSIKMELEPGAEEEDIQASSNSRDRADNNNSKSILMTGNPSSLFTFSLTEMVNMWANDDDDDEVNFFGQSSPKDTIEGYQVKPKSMLMLRKILNKHGDVFENSMLSTMTFRSMFLEVICKILSELEDKGLNKITEDELHNMIGLADEMKTMKEILKARRILKQSGKLKEEKDRNKGEMETAKTELECCEVEKKALEAKFQQLLDRICDKETACKETLARTQHESAMISQAITNAKSIVRRFVNCSLVDGLL